MAIRDKLASFIDNTDLAAKFKFVAPNPDKARKPLLDGIKRTREQFAKRATESSKAPNKWWMVKNGVVALTVKANGNTFDINGVATNHMPEERFEEFLDHFEEAVKAGEFDEELKHKGNGDAKVHIAKASAGKAAPTISGLRKSVGKSLSNGRVLDEIEAALKAEGRYSTADIDTVIAEKRAAK